MPKISVTRVREIVSEELARARLAEEATVDHQGIQKVVGAASKLLGALEAFEKAVKELPQMVSAVTPDLTNLRKTLAHAVETPSAYVHKPKGRQVVKLRPQKDTGVV